MVWGILTECVRASGGKGAPQAWRRLMQHSPSPRPASARPEDLATPNGPALLGDRVTLADRYLAPMMRYFTIVREGADLLAARPRLLG